MFFKVIIVSDGIWNTYSNADLFMNKLGLEYTLLEPQQSFARFGLIIADPTLLNEASISKLSAFVKDGGRILMLPIKEKYKGSMEKLFEGKVTVGNMPTYQLKISADNQVVRGISTFRPDLLKMYRFVRTMSMLKVVLNC